MREIDSKDFLQEVGPLVKFPLKLIWNKSFHRNFVEFKKLQSFELWIKGLHEKITYRITILWNFLDSNGPLISLCCSCWSALPTLAVQQSARCQSGHPDHGMLKELASWPVRRPTRRRMGHLDVGTAESINRPTTRRHASPSPLFLCARPRGFAAGNTQMADARGRPWASS
jgi:hypothetical protein